MGTSSFPGHKDHLISAVEISQEKAKEFQDAYNVRNLPLSQGRA
jgi:hypothetical protein